jgi:hypothetical protein
VANKDDEYAVSPYCRLDDDGISAGNEWSGAWSHSSSNVSPQGVSTESGATEDMYNFELSRLLTTQSPTTDKAELVAGETYQFGLAYWDPNETADGWTDSGHYVTGCATNWLDLVLSQDTSTNGDDTSTNGDDTSTNGDDTSTTGDNTSTNGNDGTSGATMLPISKKVTTAIAAATGLLAAIL